MLHSKGLANDTAWTTLGDEVLAQVVAVVVNGFKQPSALSFQPLGGYADEQVATGVALVRLPAPHDER